MRPGTVASLAPLCWGCGSRGEASQQENCCSSWLFPVAIFSNFSALFRPRLLEPVEEDFFFGLSHLYGVFASFRVLGDGRAWRAEGLLYRVSDVMTA